jgi:hypothetical protein
MVTRSKPVNQSRIPELPISTQVRKSESSVPEELLPARAHRRENDHKPVGEPPRNAKDMATPPTKRPPRLPRRRAIRAAVLVPANRLQKSPRLFNLPERFRNLSGGPAVKVTNPRDIFPLISRSSPEACQVHHGCVSRSVDSKNNKPGLSQFHGSGQEIFRGKRHRTLPC